ncbi:hypothetical protein NC661_01480 [Aquibacillus koreensis]|uniref:Uncharacterized protein n=1 Tax=Aquibacillus koreensis TaxID=279446 RepID=A0A9X4AI81_9BACI|nr:hypothetical protein [Aquibacillus koreensis]MCT2537602.1 hypothetical protein [Aquibacillus koreensis]MDC3419048.1 hypothetical protein [Aquibacillus koreensis]
MEDLFGAIIPILVALGWLFGMFKKDDNDQPAKRPQPRPTPSPSGPNQTESPTISDVQEEQSSTRVQTYYEQKQEQLDKLRNNMNADSNINSGKIERISSINNQRNENKIEVSSTKKQSKLSVKRNLTKRGLAESVVMAEILGPPKAVKPYRSVVQNRRN